MSTETNFGFNGNITNNYTAGLTYKGTWDALLNTPILASGVGVNGDYYIVSVAGTTNLDGITDWQIGDWAIFESATNMWQKIDNSDITGVTSVASGIGLSGGTITSTGTLSLSTPLQPIASLTGNSLKVLRVNSGETATEYATISSGGFTISGWWSFTNPLDNFTYYAGGSAAVGLTNIRILGLAIPKNCTLKSVMINVGQSSPVPTTETVTYNIDINSVPTLVGTTNSNAFSYVVSNYAMSVACLQGQLLYIQIVCPTWVTNPTQLRGAFICYFE